MYNTSPAAPNNKIIYTWYLLVHNEGWIWIFEVILGLQGGIKW